MSEIYGPYKGVVDKVHDGDTVYVKLDPGFDLTIYTRVRIFGIDAPELSTPAGKTSRDFAERLLPVGSIVSVASYGWDKYGGRIDGQITFDLQSGSVSSYVGGRDFATEMIAAGQAVRKEYK